MPEGGMGSTKRTAPRHDDVADDDADDDHDHDDDNDDDDDAGRPHAVLGFRV